MDSADKFFLACKSFIVIFCFSATIAAAVAVGIFTFHILFWATKKLTR